MSIINMTDLELAGKRLLIREDLNVPISDGLITSDARIRAALPTIKLALNAGAKVIVMSHLGRPTEGHFDNEFSLAPVAKYLADQLDRKVPVIDEWREGIEIADGELVLLENVRFNQGEKTDDEALSKAYASLCDIFVMDAFGTSHRAQASTHGVAKFADVACAGPLLAEELNALGKVMANPARPLVAIVGGSKVSTKLTVLETLSEVVDQLIVGGGIANTFLAASGNNVGSSLCEHDLIPAAKALMAATQVPVPSDVITGKTWGGTAELKNADEVQDDDSIFDIGPASSAAIATILKNAKTILWNGPVGVFEFDQFGGGTEALSAAIAESEGFSVAGGGDTLAAIDKYAIADKLSYISTGGGAFLEYVEGKVLPAVAMLELRAAK